MEMPASVRALAWEARNRRPTRERESGQHRVRASDQPSSQKQQLGCDEIGKQREPGTVEP